MVQGSHEKVSVLVYMVYGIGLKYAVAKGVEGLGSV